MATKKKSASELSFEELLAAKKPSTMKVSVCLDPEIVEARDESRKALGAAEIRLGRDPENPVLVEQRDQARAVHEAAVEAAASATVDFEFRALGRKVVEVLMKMNKPTPAQIEEFREGLKEQGLPTNETLTYDPDRFPPLLIARSCVSPRMTPEQGFDLWDSDVFSRGELGQLFQAAWTVNQIISR